MNERIEGAANEVRYFLILGRTAGKREHGDSLYTEALRRVPDTDHEIADRLMGYDATEPDDSPYKMPNESIMEQSETITEEEATARISRMNGD